MLDHKKLSSAFSNKKDHFSIICEILLIYNCRISEVLSAKWSNFIQDRFLILVAAKHSANVIIHDRELLKKISTLPRTHAQLIFPYISYYQIYSHIKKNYSHLFSQIKTKKNAKITHAFRYLNVSGIDNDRFIKDILHHNSTRSGKYYKNKVRGT